MVGVVLVYGFFFPTLKRTAKIKIKRVAFMYTLHVSLRVETISDSNIGVAAQRRRRRADTAHLCSARNTRLNIAPPRCGTFFFLIG